MRLVAGDTHHLIAHLDAEVARLEDPVTIIFNVGEVTRREREGDRLRLARLEFHLGELTEAADIGRRGGHEVAREEQDSLLAYARAGVLDIDREGEVVAVAEVLSRGTEIGVGEGGVAQAVAEGPLDVGDSIVVVGTSHRGSLLTGL